MFKKIIFLLSIILLIVCLIFSKRLIAYAAPYTVAERLEQYQDSVKERVQADFQKAGVAYPPERIVLVGIKKERILHLYAAGKKQALVLIKSYPVLAASGVLGPKLKSGDLQVPEGLYRINFLNPNSRFHLSLRVNYPNEYDQKQAKQEGRTNLGGDIMIHGNRVSIGCLAIGDTAIEEVFTIAALTGIGKISVILSPVDFRKEKVSPDVMAAKPWLPDLYQQIASELSALPN